MAENGNPDGFSERDTIAMQSAPETVAPASVAMASRELLANRYEVLSLVGQGGMGAVYRARDVELDEVVALKVLRDELAGSAELLERFRREVKLARRVTHPNVARMFDIGEHQGTKFLTMEFIDGSSLSDELERAERLPVSRVLDLAAAVAAGLAAAHEAGVVHRDLKPDNVMLGQSGRVAITDFGIAREPLGAADRGTTGLVIGTPAYMAPEQVEGVADIDARADIYAFGVMLFELLTGALPFQGQSAIAMASARLYAQAPDPRTLAPEIPSDVAAIVSRCMQRDRAARYASADELALAIGAVRAASTQSITTAVPAAVAQPTSREKTVAVLPFRNRGPAEDEYVAEGLTDDLIDSLSMTAGLRVRPRGAVARYAGTDVDPRDVGRDLGVQAVVEGTVRRSGDRVRLTARVTGTEDGFQLWAQRFDRPANDLLVVSDETARAVADALTLQTAGRNRVAPTDSVAVDLYLRGRAELRRLWPAHVARAVELFQAAHDRAPNDSSILAGFARAQARNWFFTGSGAAEARQLAERALAAAPDDVDALLAAASVKLLDGDEIGSALLARQALVRGRENPDVLELRARLLLESGYVRDAIAGLEHTLSLEPMMASARTDLIRAYALVGDDERAIAALDGSRAEPELAQSETVLRARLSMWSPRIAQTLLSLPAPATRPADAREALVAVSLRMLRGEATADDLEPVRQAAADPQSSRRFRALMCQLASEGLSRLGQHEEALVYVERAVAEGLFDLGWLDLCPLLGPLREHPRFRAARAGVAERARAVMDALA